MTETDVARLQEQMKTAFNRLDTMEEMLVEARKERGKMMTQLAEMQAAARTAQRWFGSALGILMLIAAVGALIQF